MDHHWPASPGNPPLSGAQWRETDPPGGLPDEEAGIHERDLLDAAGAPQPMASETLLGYAAPAGVSDVDADALLRYARSVERAAYERAALVCRTSIIADDSEEGALYDACSADLGDDLDALAARCPGATAPAAP